MFGSDKVGKTLLIHRFLYNKYDDTAYVQTIEEFYRHDIMYKENKRDLTIIDMGGYRQFPAMRKLAIQKSDGFLLVHSNDNIVSLKETKRLYDIVIDVKKTCNVPLLLVGCKADVLQKTSYEVPSDISDWTNQVQQIETSSKYDINVRTAFYKLIDMIDNSRKVSSTIFPTNHKNTAVVNESATSSRQSSFRRANAGLMPLMQYRKKDSFEEEEDKGVEKELRFVNGRYRRQKCSTNLLNITISPLLPGLTRYMNTKRGDSK